MIRKKFKDLEDNPNFDLEQKGMGFREILNKSKVFKVGRTSPAQVDKAVVTAEERELQLATQAAKMEKARKNAGKGAKGAELEFEQQRDVALYELSSMKRAQGQDVFYVNIPAKVRRGPTPNSKAVGEFTAEQAKKKYTERNLKVPQEITDWLGEKPTDTAQKDKEPRTGGFYTARLAREAKIKRMKELEAKE